MAQPELQLSLVPALELQLELPLELLLALQVSQQLLLVWVSLVSPALQLL